MDKEITCEDCGKVFTFNQAEQKFYDEKGFPYPKRCKSCREARKKLFASMANDDNK